MTRRFRLIWLDDLTCLIIISKNENMWEDMVNKGSSFADFLRFRPHTYARTHSTISEIALRHGCSPVNLPHIFRTPFPRNTSWVAASDNCWSYFRGKFEAFQSGWKFKVESLQKFWFPNLYGRTGKTWLKDLVEYKESFFY